WYTCLLSQQGGWSYEWARGGILCDLHLADHPRPGSLLFRPAGCTRFRFGAFSLALGTEAHRATRNCLPSRLPRSSDLDTRCSFAAGVDWGWAPTWWGAPPR